MRIAIIGAGVSAASLYWHLKDKAEIEIFEKSRGIGGRLSHRMVPEYGDFDHGGQFFTAREEVFTSVVTKLEKHSLVKAWNGKIGYIDEKLQWHDANAEQRYIGAKANSLPKWLLQGAKIRFQTRIQSIKQNNKWSLYDENGEAFHDFDFIISSAPPAQSKSLLDDHWCHSSANVEMSPCFCLLLSLPRNTELKGSFDAAFVKQPILSWFASNTSKGREGEHLNLTLHGSEDWSQDFQEDRREQMEDELKNAFFQLQEISGAKIHYLKSHFWRYAKPAAESSKASLWDQETGLGMIGDAWLGGRVEGAFMSGYSLAQTLLKEIRS